MDARTQASGRGWPLLSHPLLVAMGVILLLGALRATFEIRNVLLLSFFSLLIAVVFSFPVRFLSKVMSRGLAVWVTLLLSVGLAALATMLALPVVAAQVEPLLSQVPEGLRQAQLWVTSHAGGAVVQPSTQVAQHVQQHVSDLAASAATHVLPAAFSATEAAFSSVLVLILAAFLVHEPELYGRGLRQLFPSQHTAVFDEAWRRLGRDLHKWVGGIMVSMLLMGVFCAVGLAIVGVKGWAILGLLTFAGTFVPYAGALASAGPGLMVALAQSPTKFLEAGGVYLLVHFVEGYLVQPLVMRRAVELKPALLLFGQACLGALFGVLGIMVATPLMVCARTLIQYFWIERRLGGPVAR